MREKGRGVRPGVDAKKRLGQHFLVDAWASGRIVASVEAGPGVAVVEIGPGMGAITGGLLRRFGPRLHCVELDEEAVAYLQGVPELAGLQVHHANCLTVDWYAYGGRLSLVGNLPYNISSQILMRMYEEHDTIEGAVFMLQREVAHRVASGPGGREYGIVSVFLQAYYDVEVLFDLPPGAFSPPPRVHSSVVRLRRNGRVALGCDADRFRRVVRMAFNQRRKMLRNSLGGLSGLDLEGLGYATLRPEGLGVEEWVRLVNAWAGE